MTESVGDNENLNDFGLNAFRENQQPQDGAAN
jgi:hypothetical protein